MQVKKDYSKCTYPLCEECKANDCIIGTTGDFTQLRKYRKENNICENTKTENNDPKIVESKKKYQKSWKQRHKQAVSEYNKKYYESKKMVL